jgi:hypothetical protein
LDNGGAGTLRSALANAGNGDTINITVVTPGTDKIELTSVLPPITKSITIKGNGVTLTPGAGYPNASDTSHLLTISLGAQVTIQRVHFTGGKTEYDGGAIWAIGELTLESCIFSWNECIDDGGAVSSYNTLTIQGCTFYQNKSGDRGGAVYIYAPGKSTILTGNLLYKNIATYNVISGSTTTSGGYNVYEGNTQGSSQGWTLVGTDKNVSTETINTTTFKPKSGSPGLTEIGILPLGLIGPDFYGNTRTVGSSTGGATGAVDRP